MIKGVLARGSFEARLDDNTTAELRMVAPTDDRARHGDKAYVILRLNHPVLGPMAARNIRIREMPSGPNAGQLRVLWPQFATGRERKQRDPETGEMRPRREYVDSFGPAERSRTNPLILEIYHAAVAAIAGKSTDTDPGTPTTLRAVDPKLQEQLSQLNVQSQTEAASE